jgi:hypothetical protein
MRIESSPPGIAEALEQIALRQTLLLSYTVLCSDNGLNQSIRLQHKCLHECLNVHSARQWHCDSSNPRDTAAIIAGSCYYCNLLLRSTGWPY